MNDRTRVPSAVAAVGRFAARWIPALVAALVVLAAPAAEVSATTPAENTLVSSSPANGAIVATKPQLVVLTFAQEIGEASTFALSCGATPIDLPPREFGDDGRSMSVDLTDVAVEAGPCSIAWSTTDDAGTQTASGIVTFSVETGSSATPATTVDAAAPPTTLLTPEESGTPVPTTAPAATSDDDPIDRLSVTTEGNASVWMGRLLSTIGIAILFGALVLITAAWPEGVEYMVTIRFLRAVWFLAFLGTIVFVAAAAGSVNGDGFGAGLNPAAWIDLLDSDWAGRLVLVRLVLVVACGWVAFRPDRVLDPVTQMAALGIPALATITTGISRTVGDGALLGALLGAAHALAMAVWFGGAVLVARVVLAGPGEEDLVHAVRGFSRISIGAIVLTIGTGVAAAVRLDGGNLLEVGHGRVVVLKAAVVAIMVFLAFGARQFVARRMARAHEMSVPLADRLRRAFGAEAGIGVVTMMLSAWLLALAPPNIDTTPRIPYAISTTFTDEAAGLEVVVRLTDAQVGVLAGLEVEVTSPELGLTSLDVDFLAPPGQFVVGGITQPIPLREPGRAVRLAEDGIPFGVAGPWQLQVRAVVSGIPVTVPAQTLNVAEADGTAAGTVVTLPASSVVELTTLPN